MQYHQKLKLKNSSNKLQRNVLSLKQMELGWGTNSVFYSGNKSSIKNSRNTLYISSVCLREPESIPTKKDTCFSKKTRRMFSQTCPQIILKISISLHSLPPEKYSAGSVKSMVSRMQCTITISQIKHCKKGVGLKELWHQCILGIVQFPRFPSSGVTNWMGSKTINTLWGQNGFWGKPQLVGSSPFLASAPCDD